MAPRRPERDARDKGAGFRCERLGGRPNRCEFRSCPYCFGDAAAVAARDPARFCDFEPGADPVHFGFPLASARLQRG